MINFDGSHLEKRPDLSISLTDRRRSFPLTVECKLIDANTGKQVDLYCRKGLARFLKGEYAWYAQEAMMLAYVRDGSTISLKLTSYLAKNQTQKTDLFATEKLPELLNSSCSDLARSRHSRKFRYIDQNPDDNPGPIAVWHLWLPIP
ncbi:MAG: hypothetical protein H6974_07515 [Gammaproteobacteria bacterium]|nr:hypothetical protein [Gammaproteobacteria bacterium]MCP5196619.1 hypothetical protein [Gammaproteobacteria bacterium]